MREVTRKRFVLMFEGTRTQKFSASVRRFTELEGRVYL